MTGKNKVIEYVKEVFPKANIYFLKKFKNIHSEIFLLDLKINEKNKAQKVLIKSCDIDITNEIRIQNEFRKKNKSGSLRVPKIFDFDQKRNLVVMEYVEGKSFKKILLEKNNKDNDFLDGLVRQSAAALSQFHKMFKKKDSERLAINSPLLDIKDFPAGLSSRCNMKTKVESFIDFAPWNIILTPDRNLYLIDFPERKCIATPHLDLARFKFSLGVLKQYPQFRFFKINWWSEDKVYNDFLGGYCKEMKFKPNKADFELIDYFEKEYAKKLRSIYRTKRQNIRFVLESVYLRNFLRNFVE